MGTATDNTSSVLVSKTTVTIVSQIVAQVTTK
jgi:hypothetical protein